MTVEVTLRVTGIDLRDETTVALLAEHLGDYLFGETSGITTMTVFSDGNPVNDAVRALRCANAQPMQELGLRVVEVKEDLVNIGEITRRIGDFSREAIRKWSADASFPTPIDALGGERSSYIWRWADVVHWLMDAKGIDMDEELPDQTTVTHINAHIHGVDDYRSDALHVQLTDKPKLATVVTREFGPRKSAMWVMSVTDMGYETVVANAR